MVAGLPLRLAEALLVGALNVTCPPATGSPNALATVTASGDPKAVPAVVS